MKDRRKPYKLIALIIGVLIVLLGGFLLFKNLVNDKNLETKDKTSPTESIEKKIITPLLYEVTKEGSNNKMYLFGSIHAADLKNVEFADYILNAYNNSHYVACEFDIIDYQNDQGRQVSDAVNMMYTDETSIKDHLSSDTYDMMVKFLTSKNLYSPAYDSFKPVFFESLITSTMISDANLNINGGIDEYFLNKAKKDNKTILEVESSDFQFNELTNFSDVLYDLMIKEVIEEYDKEVDGLKKLYQAWTIGDAKEILKSANEEIEEKDKYTDEQNKEIENYNKVLITNRNAEMTKKAIDYFNNNLDVFFMVGSLHIIGDDGIAKKLESQGYNVKEIKITQ